MRCDPNGDTDTFQSTARSFARCSLLYLRFLWNLPSQTRWLFILSGAIFVGGAVGVEMSTDWYADEDLLNTLAYNLWNTVEEGMEMAGVVLFIHAHLKYINQEQNVAVDVKVESQDS